MVPAGTIPDMTQDTVQQNIIATLQRLGLELRNPAAICAGENRARSILTAEHYNGGPAFSHVLAYDAEMIEADDAYSEWVHEWARATGKEDRVTDVASHIDFDGGTSWLTYRLDGRDVRIGFTQEADWLDIEVSTVFSKTSAPSPAAPSYTSTTAKPGPTSGSPTTTLPSSPSSSPTPWLPSGEMAGQSRA